MGREDRQTSSSSGTGKEPVLGKGCSKKPSNSRGGSRVCLGPEYYRNFTEREGQDHQEGWTTPSQRHSLPEKEVEREQQKYPLFNLAPTLPPKLERQTGEYIIKTYQNKNS